MTKYGIIFITAEEQIWDGGKVYDYQDKILVNEYNKEYSIKWSGQKKQGKDYIVTNCNREIHVCVRMKKKSIL